MTKKERYIDLHVHTSCSDGERSLKETIEDAKKAGLSAVAITDHNGFTVEQTIRDEDLEIIPGVEFSTTYLYGENRKAEIHIIGLFFEGVTPKLNSLFEGINKMAYIEAILDKLGELGMAVTMKELEEQNPDSRQFGRTQIADILVKKGYAVDRADAMDRWIGNRSPYFIHSLDCIHYIEMESCVQEICRYGGFPILAHPFHYKFTDAQIEELVMRFRNASAQPLGIEVYYRDYCDNRIAFLNGLAEKYRLFPSAGSDRHKANHPFAQGQYKLLERIKEIHKAFP